MSNPSFFETCQGRRLAYYQVSGAGPGIVFLGGFKSDMQGSKAQYLDVWARAQGRAFLRFDYSGHGQSSERFEDGAIGDWANDAAAIITALTDGPQVLVGSSMGGWISLLMCKRIPDKIAALVTIAAAPDFTEDGFWTEFDDAQRSELMAAGQVAVPSEYGDPYIITKRLIEEGRDNLVLRSPLKLNIPVRFLQGTADQDVSVETALRLLNHADGPDMHLRLVKGADHRFSDDTCLKITADAITDVLEKFE
ncbi:alpha/beta fold hydrolase [Pseudaestuariivita rosea]|uniref:alpha/beta fold hydrolase n=1 Tax=Pseudaestuariivita rosea TaxID=2763263 RepID=UPI001ABA8843|nr:alpha/beta hydrolase [Pseudaestuariivita rosea]